MIPCPLCGQDVDWITARQAEQVLGVSAARVRQFIAGGRLPGSLKKRPGGGLQPLWLIPISSVTALKEARDAQAEVQT